MSRYLIFLLCAFLLAIFSPPDRPDFPFFPETGPHDRAGHLPGDFLPLLPGAFLVLFCGLLYDTFSAGPWAFSLLSISAFISA